MEDIFILTGMKYQKHEVIFLRPVHLMSLIRWLVCIPLVLMLLNVFSLFSATHADETPPLPLTIEESEWLDNNSGKLLLYFKADYYPMEFSSESGSFSGISADIISLIEKRLGIIFHKLPLDDMNKHLSSLETGESAIIPAVMSTKEREQYLFFTKPYYVVPVVIITSGNVKDKIGLNELKGWRVGTVTGYAVEEYLREKNAN